MMRVADAGGGQCRFERIGPSVAATPLVLSVPHAGRDYPAPLLADSAVPRALLEQLEDRHVDLLIGAAVRAGAVAIVARVARAWIDLNRGEEDLDPALRIDGGSGGPETARSRSGLGLLPMRLGRHALWRRGPTPADAAARIASAHRPYHAAIERALAAAAARHGFAVLLDCHSMPPLPGALPAQVVIGDRHGHSAGARIAVAMLEAARASGRAVALNSPYAGAYTLRRHGRPADGIHALQIEIDRSLYLSRDMRTPGAGLSSIAALIATLGEAAVGAASPDHAIAAE